MCEDLGVTVNLILKMVQSEWSTQMGQGRSVAGKERQVLEAASRFTCGLLFT